MKKTDPEESGMCCACGWLEQGTPYFCELANTFCHLAPKL
jgi:hypothetical protein